MLALCLACLWPGSTADVVDQFDEVLELQEVAVVVPTAAADSSAAGQGRYRHAPEGTAASLYRADVARARRWGS